MRRHPRHAAALHRHGAAAWPHHRRRRLHGGGPHPPAHGDPQGIAAALRLRLHGADFRTALRHLESGAVRGADLVTGVVGLEALPAAFEALRRPSEQVKVLVDPAL
jgi:threonine dehydrogenase-like Zn-dependent dehydrogenase